MTFSPKTEVQNKLERLRGLLAAYQVDAIQLRQTANIAWLTGGASTYINTASDTGPVTLFVTADRAYAFSDTIETPRLRQELAFEAIGLDLVTDIWHQDSTRAKAITAGKRIGYDMPGDCIGTTGTSVDDAVRQLRRVLQPEEIERLRMGGKIAAEVIDEATRATRPGDTEFTLAGRLANGTYARGGLPIVALVASDDRIFQFRHPLPTMKRVEKYAMLIVCVRYGGLVVSVTRLIHFGPLPDIIRTKAEACARIDASLNLGTRPGRTIREMFEIARLGYQKEGYPEAIDEHHQGGLAGYQAREIIATPGDSTPIVANQCFAWNPSIRGVKSEDTILVTASGVEVLTKVAGWPTMTITVPEGQIERPQILVM